MIANIYYNKIISLKHLIQINFKVINKVQYIIKNLLHLFKSCLQNQEINLYLKYIKK